MYLYIFTKVLSLNTGAGKCCSSSGKKKQQEQYEAKKQKGLTMFELKPGDTVLSTNMKNIGRKGGKIEPGWTVLIGMG